MASQDSPLRTPEAEHHEYVDLLVIGWGKAGKTLAGQAARAGRRVALVEQSSEMVGGTCINIACVPTKILIHDAASRRESDDPQESFTAAVDGARIEGRLHSSESLQHVSPLPRSLVVVGGGYVGLEFASMFAHYGSEVTVVDRGQRPLADEDADVAETAAEAMRTDGITFVSGATVTAVSDGPEQAQVTYQLDGAEQRIDADAVLLALGRAPATDGLGLESAGVQVDDGGFVVVDEHLRTSAPGVYAVGDVNGGPQFTYVSLDDHRIMADQLLGSAQRSAADRSAVPYTMFLTPPLARVGLTEDQARDRGFEVLVGVKAVADVAAAPRAKIEGEPRGIVKVVVDGGTDRVLGAALMHVHSQEVINLVSLAIRQGITASTLRDSIYTHPSATEALNEVLGALQ